MQEVSLKNHLATRLAGGGKRFIRISSYVATPLGLIFFVVSVANGATQRDAVALSVPSWQSFSLCAALSLLYFYSVAKAYTILPSITAQQKISLKIGAEQALQVLLARYVPGRIFGLTRRIQQLSDQSTSFPTAVKYSFLETIALYSGSLLFFALIFATWAACQERLDAALGLAAVTFFAAPLFAHAANAATNKFSKLSIAPQISFYDTSRLTGLFAISFGCVVAASGIIAMGDTPSVYDLPYGLTLMLVIAFSVLFGSVFSVLPAGLGTREGLIISLSTIYIGANGVEIAIATRIASTLIEILMIPYALFLRWVVAFITIDTQANLR